MPAEQLKPALLQMGMSSSMVDLLLEMAESLNSGYMRTLEPRSPKNTTPTSLETFVSEVFVPALDSSSAICLGSARFFNYPVTRALAPHCGRLQSGFLASRKNCSRSGVIKYLRSAPWIYVWRGGQLRNRGRREPRSVRLGRFSSKASSSVRPQIPETLQCQSSEGSSRV